MSSSDVTKTSTTQPNGRKHVTRKDARVAIPLPLSRPRRKPEQNAENKSTVDGEEKLVQERGNTKVSDGAKEVEAVKPTINGFEMSHGDGADSAKAVTPGSRESTSMAADVFNAHEPLQNGVTHTSTPSQEDVYYSKSVPNSLTTQKPTSIRTELPPAFIPFAEQHTPKSAGSNAHFHQSSQIFSANTNPPSRPGTSGIMFGGHESSRSSPAPHQSLGSTFLPPSQHVSQRPTHPGGYGSSTHGHHSSESHTNPLYQTSHLPPQTPWVMHRQPPPSLLQAQYHQPVSAFRYPQRDFFSSHETQNGFAMTPGPDTPGSATAMEFPKPTTGDVRPSNDTFTQPLHHRSVLSQHRPYSQGQQMQSDYRVSQDNSQLLRQHTQSFFSSSIFSDVKVQIILQRDDTVAYRDAHKVLLARSPTLLEMLSSTRAEESSQPNQLAVWLPGKWLSVRAFDEALEWLYGGSLLGDSYPETLAKEQADGTVERLRFALSYIATGHFLQLPPLAQRGLEVARTLLNWDTLSLALEFALEGGLSKSWLSDEGLQNGERGHAAMSNTESPPGLATYDPFATQLLHTLMEFTASAFPTNFYSDNSAPELSANPRLPSTQSHSAPVESQNKPSSPSSHQHSFTHRPTRSSNDPRLSNIRFGELGGPGGPQGTPRPSPTTTAISSLLFSLPYQLLKYLLEHPVLSNRLGVETVASIMRQVIVERETRRSKALKTASLVNGKLTDSTKKRVIDNIYWEEGVEVDTHSRLGLQLARRRVGGQDVSV